MPVCRLNDANIAYTDRGTGPTLVLLHGFPLDKSIWDDAGYFLEQHFRVIAPDLRGFGESPCDRPFTIESLADDIHQILMSIGASPCILGGLSMGGYVALAFAKKYLSDLRALVLIDTKAAADTPEAKQVRQQMIDLVRQRGSKAIADQMFPKMMAPQSSESVVAIKLRSIMESCPPLTIEHALAAMRDREDYAALLPGLKIPTLIVVGAEDAIASPEVARAMHAAVPRSKLAIIPGAGHMAPLERPKAFADAMIAGMN
jgi:pimeloyl-ACP methyl ester carboxylesterase